MNANQSTNWSFKSFSEEYFTRIFYYSHLTRFIFLSAFGWYFELKSQGVEECKYLGSVIQNNERCTRKGKKRAEPGWKWWRRVVYKMVARSAMMCGLTKRQRWQSWRFSLGVIRMDRISNEYSRGLSGLDMSRGGIVDIVDNGCWVWSCWAGGKEEDTKEIRGCSKGEAERWRDRDKVRWRQMICDGDP